MNRIHVVLLGAILVGVLAVYCSVSDVADEHPTFMDVEVEVNELMGKARYQEALALLQSVAHKFPDRDYEIQSYFGVLYAHTGDYRRCLDVWEAGLDKGYFFDIHRERDVFRPLEKYERFQAIAEENDRLRAAALEESRTKVKVVLPSKKEADDYGLFLVLHGGGSSMEWAERYWRSRRLEKEFAVAYVQSYLYEGMKSYGWPRPDRRATRDIRKLYEDIVARYPIDSGRVITGGTSAGGVMAIDIAMSGVIPAAGFIGVCSGKPEELNAIRIRMARDRGVKGVIIGGENDLCLPYQREMVEAFRRGHFPHEFIVVQGMGASYPADFPRRIDRAVDYILGGK